MNSYEILDKGLQRLATALERIGPRVVEPHGSDLRGLGANARALCAVAFEADEAEQERPNFEVLLMDLLGEIQRSTVREWSLTPDQAGVDAAKLALGEMAPTLAPQPGDLASNRRDLLEAVRAQDATCTLHVFASKRARFDGDPDEEHLDYPVPPGASLCKGLVFLVPAAPPAANKRRATVIEVSADGRCTVARVKLEPPTRVAPVALAADEDRF